MSHQAANSFLLDARDDYNGNTQTMVNSSGTTTYSSDFQNRLTSAALPGSGGTVYLKYDPFGRRIYKSSSSGTSIYAYDGDNLIEETNSSGGAVARYSQGLSIDEPLAMLRGGTTSYYQADGLGSLTSLSNTSGALANTYTYDSFGNLVASSGSLVNSFRYTGREFDTETGLYYYRARYYDPQSGRFASEDQLGFRTGTNFYRYVFNSPTDLADPLGLAPTCVPTISGIICAGDQSPVQFQIAVLQALFPGSSPKGASLILPMSCDDAKKMLENTGGYHTGHFWDGYANGWPTINPFLFWDPLFHSGGSEWRNTSGFHFRMKYSSGGCDKTCTVDDFHIDQHNPLFDPYGHFWHDLLRLN